jgi:hypothetical protein
MPSSNNNLSNNQSDIKESTRYLSAIYHPGDTIELRIIVRNGYITAGYFDYEHKEQLAKIAAIHSGKAKGVYTAINSCNPQLLARACNKVKDRAETTTTDKDIVKRRFLPIDADPDRPANISSTDSEHQAAIDKAYEIREHLELNGISRNSIIIVDSGNGAHVHLAIDLPNTNESTIICKKILQVLALKFDNDLIHIDQTTFNASRIIKLPGTMACKGDNIPDRPWRMSKILELPEHLEVIFPDILKTLAAGIPEPPKQEHRGNGQALDFPKWAAEHSITIHKIKELAEYTAYYVEDPFDPSHNGDSPAVFQFKSGGLAFKCFHNSCQGNGWKEYRLHYEPNAYQSKTSTKSELPITDYQEQSIQQDDNGLVINLPDAAWANDIIREYRDLMGPTTEASDNYHYGGALQVIGYTLNRKIFFHNSRPLYPNFYSVFVGPTAISKKDTAMSRAEDIITDLHSTELDNESGEYSLITGVSSAEGLFQYIVGDDKKLLLKLSEYATLPQKSKQSGAGNLISLVTELWDMRERYEARTITNGRKVSKRPFFSIMAGSTPEWLTENMDQSNIMGGYANRWLYFWGYPKEPKPFTPKIDSNKKSHLLTQINEIRVWANGLSNNGEITASTEALELYKEWYIKFRKSLETDGIIPSLLVRLPDYAWKIAMINACCSLLDTIYPDNLQSALEVVNFMDLSIKHIFRNYSTSANRQEEDRLIRILQRNGEKSHRDLYHLMNISGEELTKLIGPMLKIGLIKYRDVLAGNNKNITLYSID